MQKKEIQAEALTTMINALAKADNEEKLDDDFSRLIWDEQRRQPTARERALFQAEINNWYQKLVDRRTKLRS